ncbi:MAG TPA: ABC transporter ATP-binding protein [Candidatus Pelethenecus sp.]|nr:ABC transporter ATP-binding protein [Candidatus Pelethenecus sp.]
MIQASNLIKKYDDQVVVNNLTYSFEENKFYCIMGASGSGKSTLLYLLSGLEKADEGHVSYNEYNYNDLKESGIAELRLNEFGFVFQSYNLISNLNVRENILVPAFMQKKKKKDVQEKMISICEFLKIDNLLDKYPSQLSGGEQQRVAIARALINEAKVVFADEPTGNLDSKMSNKVLNLLLTLQTQKKFTLIMVTHNPEIAKKADVVLNIVDGRFENI